MDLINLDKFITDKEAKSTCSMLLLKMEDPNSAEIVQQMDSIAWVVFRWRIFVPSTKTRDELIGSGNLSLIRNDSIISLMLDIEQRYEFLAVNTEHMRREYDHYLYDRSAILREMSPHIDLESTVKLDTLIGNLELIKDKLPALTKQYHDLLHDLPFRNGLKLAVFNNNGMRKQALTAYKEVERLIAKTDEEINEK